MLTGVPFQACGSTIVRNRNTNVQSALGHSQRWVCFSNTASIAGPLPIGCKDLDCLVSNSPGLQQMHCTFPNQRQKLDLAGPLSKSSMYGTVKAGGSQNTLLLLQLRQWHNANLEGTQNSYADATRIANLSYQFVLQPAMAFHASVVTYIHRSCHPQGQ
jgi:hypothetical protein